MLFKVVLTLALLMCFQQCRVILVLLPMSIQSFADVQVNHAHLLQNVANVPKENVDGAYLHLLVFKQTRHVLVT